MKLQFKGLIRQLLMQGVTPEKIALSMAVGAALGIFPVIGSTTILCAMAAVVFRLNLPAIQIVNYAVYPLQIILLIPFLRSGAWLFHSAPLGFSLAQVTSLIRGSAFHAMAVLWTDIWHAAIVWCLIAPLAIILLYFALKRILTRLPFSGFKSETPSPG